MAHQVAAFFEPGPTQLRLEQVRLRISGLERSNPCPASSSMQGRIHKCCIQQKAGATSQDRPLLMDRIFTQRQNPKQFAALLQEQRRGFTNTAQIMGMATVAAHKRQALQQVFCSPDSLIGTNQQGWKRSVGINQQNAGANGVIGLGQVMRHSHLLKDVAP